MLRRVPRDEAFYGLLGHTAAHIVAAADELTGLLGAADDAERKAIAKRITEIENRGDESTHQLIRAASEAFITPLDRGDLVALARGLDNCLDQIELVADLVRLHRLAAFSPRMGRQVDTVVRMAALTLEAMPRLRAPGTMSDYWIEINRLENQGDRNYRKLTVELCEEYAADPVGLQRALLVVGALEATTNAFEAVAHLVEGIAAKEA